MTTIVEPNPVGVVNPTRIRWRPPKLTPSLVFKTVFGVVVLGGLVYFVGGQVLLETAIKIVVAVGISVGLFVVANKLFDLAYPRWALFSGLAGAGIGFITFFVLDANRAAPRPPGRPVAVGADRRGRPRRGRPGAERTEHRSPGSCRCRSSPSPHSAC